MNNGLGSRIPTLRRLQIQGVILEARVAQKCEGMRSEDSGGLSVGPIRSCEPRQPRQAASVHSPFCSIATTGVFND